MLLGQHNPTFNNVSELRISANTSPYGFLGFVINSTLNILSARGLVHSERQRNVKNVTLRNTELHNTKKAIYFTTPKITFIKHRKNNLFLPCCEPVLFCAFGAQNRVQFAWAKKTLNHSGSIPNMESTLEKKASCRYKTEMDKRSGFWQVDLTPNPGATRLHHESAALGRCGCRRARGRQDQWGRHARSLPGCCYWG